MNAPTATATSSNVDMQDTLSSDSSPGVSAGPQRNQLRVLLVEDEVAIRESTRGFLEHNGLDVCTAANGEDAMRLLNNDITAVITDLRMPKMSGLDLLKHAREIIPNTPVIVLTGQGSEQDAVSALKAGAFHYLTKPINPEHLLDQVKEAVERHQMSVQLTAFHDRVSTEAGFCGMIGRSESMRRVFEHIRMIADTRSTVLIEGESGTGKELVARAIHLNSGRAESPFVALNCAALPESLIESELFGHIKGAFTGATDNREGKFVAAGNGTLLIDEIGEMQLELQTKLLRAIETRQVNPLGSNQEIAVSARIIASTNRSLAEMQQAGTFREDLYYRLNVVMITVPPLRERREDIPLLARAYLDKLAQENKRQARDISAEALRTLQGYDWPGNVRELRNVIEGMIVMSDRDVLDVADLPAKMKEQPHHPPLESMISAGMPMADIEKEAIRQTLLRTNGKRTEASRVLGLSIRTLQRRIKQYALDV